mgnify:CR=1 FL=1
MDFFELGSGFVLGAIASTFVYLCTFLVFDLD